MSRSSVFSSLASQEVSAAEFDKLDGVTATTTELNVVTGGITTLGAVTAGTLGSNVVFPAGHVLSVIHQKHQSAIFVSTSSNVYNTISVNFPRKSASSSFIVMLSAMTKRSGVVGWAHVGYTYGVESLSASGAATTLLKFSDQTSERRGSVIYENTSTGAIGDVIYIGTHYNTSSSESYFTDGTITVMEVA